MVLKFAQVKYAPSPNKTKASPAPDKDEVRTHRFLCVRDCATKHKAKGSNRFGWDNARPRRTNELGLNLKCSSSRCPWKPFAIVRCA